MLCLVDSAVTPGEFAVLADAPLTDCLYAAVTVAEYQALTVFPPDFELLGITSQALAADYAFGFFAVGLGFILAFPISMVLKTLKLL